MSKQRIIISFLLLLFSSLNLRAKNIEDTNLSIKNTIRTELVYSYSNGTQSIEKYYFSRLIHQLKGTTYRQNSTVAPKKILACLGMTISSFPYPERFVNTLDDWTQRANSAAAD